LSFSIPFSEQTVHTTALGNDKSLRDRIS